MEYFKHAYAFLEIFPENGEEKCRNVTLSIFFYLPNVIRKTKSMREELQE